MNDDVPGEPTALPATPLTPFQIEVSSAFFDLPESRGFLLAGGAALVAQHLITRPTRDLDFFTSLTEAVPAAADAFRALAGLRRWQVTTIREASSFVRMHVHHGADEVLVDLAVDAAPGLTPSMTVAGPTLDQVELAARSGITAEALAEMLDTLGRFSDDDVPLEPDAIDDVRRFFATWASDLRSPGASH